MIDNSERREVARRLRELDYSDLQESLICAYLDALGIKGYEDWVGIAHRLADLIEPNRGSGGRTILCAHCESASWCGCEPGDEEGGCDFEPSVTEGEPPYNLYSLYEAVFRRRPRDEYAIEDDEVEELVDALLDICNAPGHERIQRLKPPNPDATASYKGWSAEVYDPDGALASPSNVAADLVRSHADLIEPSEPKVKCVAEVKVDGEQLEKLAHDAAVELTGIDRDALLELADEMENNTWYETGFDHHIAVRFARRIREALGGEGCDHADEREIIAWVRDHGGLADVKRYWTLGVEASTACGVEVTDDASLTSCLHVLGCLTEYDVPLARAAVAELWPGGRPDECDNDRVIDELRRRLMPEGMEWPRDAKGVPIVRGETVFANGGGKGDGRAWYVRRVCPGFAYPVDAEDGKGERRDLKAHWVTHERPAPKVLDADGVEIRKGDTVYGVENGTEYEVCEAKLPRVTVEYWCAGISVHSGIAPSLLTHRAPVLAADGRPLREGGMVWDGKGNGPYIIKKIEDDGIVRIDSNDLDYFASEFFSERPDSWERLEEDCAKSDVDYCAERGLLDPSCDTVEGDASTRHCTDCCCTCDEKMARDLVRRSKKLAERGESGDAVPAWYAAGRLEAVARSIREILGVES